MASVDFIKLHTANETKAMMEHCDKEERSKHEHSNKDIRKDLIQTNFQMKRAYSETAKAYDDRIAYLDAQDGANKRKDRVTCFSLEIPFPERLNASDGMSWSNKVLSAISSQYGQQNILQAYVHRDEVHDYVDAETGKLRTSRCHIHVLVIPEHDGKLNGKWFSSKANMNKLNNTIQAMTQSEYGCDFMDGSKRKSRAEVEELKNRSDIKALEADLKRQYDAKEALLAREQERANKDLIERSRALDEREAELAQREQKLDQKAIAVGRTDLANANAEPIVTPQHHRGEDVFGL